ncbi:PCNT115 protein [Hibiscus syriacus]|uniref:PCNT115 protein n=1 Tax=Hibiscus syriacus TaxID=106335 RepID=A0A6A3BMQ5_HIBSY|nr:PCNT115 protein [Hibiscus syriacus]
MILGSNSIRETHYVVLSVKEDASYEEIRTIQKAWEILSDPNSRTVYDRELRDSRQDVVASEDIGLDDMMVEDVGEVMELYYQCRCGDHFSVDSSELSKMGYTLLRDGSEIFGLNFTKIRSEWTVRPRSLTKNYWKQMGSEEGNSHFGVYIID